MKNCRVCGSDKDVISEPNHTGPCGIGSWFYPGHNHPNVCNQCIPNDRVRHYQATLTEAAMHILEMLVEVACDYCKDEDSWICGWKSDINFEGPTYSWLKDPSQCTCYTEKLKWDFFNYMEGTWEHAAKILRKET